MIHRLIFRVLISVLGLSLWGCAQSTCEETYENPIYIVKTITGISVEDFAAREEWKTMNFDWPLVIDLESDAIDTVYQGWVKLARLGWTPIDRSCTEPNCFLLDTKDKLGPVEFIVFGDLDISLEQIIGTFDPAGPTLDTEPIPFTALRISAAMDT
jgi:hypothetical protein